MKKQTVICPYCNSVARLRPAADIYCEHDYANARWLYVCSNWPKCDAYVSAHNHNKAPMGTLANGELRNKRIMAHRALEKYRRLTRMNRSEIYAWLVSKLDIAATQIHIAKFSDAMCDRVISLCEESCRSYRQSQNIGA